MISGAFFPFTLYFNSKTCLWFSHAFVRTLRTMSTLSWGSIDCVMNFVLFLLIV
jgi:hypothetical protein